MFSDPKTNKKQAKILLWGSYGTGKTVLALQFPRPALIDMERGAEHYAGRYEFKTFQTNEPEKVKQAVSYLKQTKTDRETVILDSMTEFWASLQKKWQAMLLERNKQSRGNKIEYYDIQPKDWGLIKGDMKSFLLSLVSVDMNVIVTCREKDLYSESELLKKVGVTFDSDRTLPYLFDTVVRLEKVNGKYFSVVEKDRTGLLPQQAFETKYEIFAKAFGFVSHESVTPVPVQKEKEPVSDPVTLEKEQRARLYSQISDEMKRLAWQAKDVIYMAQAEGLSLDPLASASVADMEKAVAIMKNVVLQPATKDMEQAAING